MKKINWLPRIALILLIPAITFAQKSKKIKDDGMAGPLHEKNVGKIVFAKAMIKREETSDASFLKEFSIKEDIFFRVYMKESIYNAMCDSGYSTSFLARDAEFRFVLKMDNAITFERELYLRGLMSEDDKKVYTSFRGCFKKGDDEIGAVDWKYFIEEKQQDLTPGKHTIKMELYARSSNDKQSYRGIPVANGEFTLNVPVNFIDPNDPTVCLPKAVKKDAVMEGKMLAAFNAKNKADGYNIEVTKVLIKSTDWTIEKNPYTHKIIKRWMEAHIAYREKGKCAYENAVFSQDYTGSGYQDKVYVSSRGGAKSIHCDCLKGK